MMHKLLEWDVRLPFRLATTSFIYPDRILPNVGKLGGLFDEIELLVFESIPQEVLPSADEINELARLSRELDVTYNVHLPVDVSLSDPSPEKREKAAETLLRIIESMRVLNPTTHTLHLEMPETCSRFPDRVGEWIDRTQESLGRLVRLGVDPSLLSIENLDYPLDILDTVIRETGVCVCMDTGHLVAGGEDVAGFFSTYRDRMPLIHLHGVDFSKQPPRDHLGLNVLPRNVLDETLTLLKGFSGTVSLEVFRLESLEASLEVLFAHNWS